MPNRLANEASPYLQQHKDNPVDWFSWGDEALKLALDEDKPIFLSIGYSSCHWCHVMEHESFETQDIAEILNAHFVSIKVDREERPDIDSLYMTAVQAMTGHGGWPLNAFLTPDLVPFYGGTYWPPEERQGMPAFKNVLTAVADAYREKRQEVEQNADQVRQLLTVSSTKAPRSETLNRQILDDAFKAASKSFDNLQGGFGSAPKFPQASALEFLIRRHFSDHQSATARMLGLTLDRMATGGMYDQIGGGFHRYSVDAVWLVPHFEKMLYDNAQLARLYLDAAKLLEEPRHGAVAADVIDYVLREMTGDDGEFFSTQDADTEGEEGRFYVWTEAEISEAVDELDAPLAIAIFGVTPDGNFEGRTIPTRVTPLRDVAEELSQTSEEIEARLPEIRESLRHWRERRTRPGRDEKVIASWNGMMLRAIAEAARALSSQEYLDAARANGTFLREKMIADDGLFHVYQDGQARIAGFLEDYANVIDGFIALYQAVYDRQWIDDAVMLAENMIERFEDESTGLLFDSERAHEPLVSRARDIQDGATPSGNAVAAEVLMKLGRMTENRDYERRASALLGHLARPMAEQPLGFGRALVALDQYLGVPKEIAISGSVDNSETQAFVAAAFRSYQPHALIGVAEPGNAEQLPFLRHRPMRDGKVTGYLCEHFSCLAPVTDPNEFASMIDRGSGVVWSEF
ncbi:thioredoxin domain-containing protein [soil metagenome]